MKYRALDDDQDYSFGGKGNGMLENTPETVAQAVSTRLRLLQGEWFPDPDVGVAYMTKILGAGTAGTRDQEVQKTILDTPGVTEIASYLSYMDTARGFHVEATINTAYGTTTINV